MRGGPSCPPAPNSGAYAGQPARTRARQRGRGRPRSGRPQAAPLIVVKKVLTHALTAWDSPAAAAYPASSDRPRARDGQRPARSTLSRDHTGVSRYPRVVAFTAGDPARKQGTGKGRQEMGKGRARHRRRPAARPGVANGLASPASRDVGSLVAPSARPSPVRSYAGTRPGQVGKRRRGRFHPRRTRDVSGLSRGPGRDPGRRRSSAPRPASQCLRRACSRLSTR